jgi:hypothetical protein
MVNESYHVIAAQTITVPARTEMTVPAMIASHGPGGIAEKYDLFLDPVPIVHDGLDTVGVVGKGLYASDASHVTAHEGLRLGWWIMVVARICACACARLSLWFAYLFGYLRGLAVAVLPVIVRFDVARGTRGIVVRVNVARVLLLLRESCLYAGLAHGVWFPFFPFSLTQPLFSPPPPHTATVSLCAIKFTTSLLDVLSCSHVLEQLCPPAYP